MLLKSLINQKVIKVSLSADARCLKIECEEGANLYITCDDEGQGTGNDDKSWINHISGLDAILNQQITGCRVNPLEENENSYSISNQSLSISMTSPQGYCDIEFRNENNGYYGGNVFFSLESQYDDFTELTEDF